jgi:hypothetical protein
MVQVEEKVFEKAFNEVWEYAKRHDMVFATDGLSIKVSKLITEEVEKCVSEAVKEEEEEVEKVCRRSCLVRHGEPTEWQLQCLDTCFEFWMMTRRAECAERVGFQQLEHLHAIETLLKQYGLWYHSYWRIFIDKVVLFIMEFKPPPEVW